MCSCVHRSIANPMKKKTTFIGRIYTWGGINNKFVNYFFSNIFCFNLFIFWINIKFLDNKKKEEANNVNNLILNKFLLFFAYNKFFTT